MSNVVIVDAGSGEVVQVVAASGSRVVTPAWRPDGHALVADGVESLADIFSSVIVWRGMVIAAEPADELGDALAFEIEAPADLAGDRGHEVRRRPAPRS